MEGYDNLTKKEMQVEKKEKLNSLGNNKKE